MQKSPIWAGIRQKITVEGSVVVKTVSGGPSVHSFLGENLANFVSSDFKLHNQDIKAHIFWEGHKILQNVPLTFDCMYCSQK